MNEYKEKINKKEIIIFETVTRRNECKCKRKPTHRKTHRVDDVCVCFLYLIFSSVLLLDYYDFCYFILVFPLTLLSLASNATNGNENTSTITAKLDCGWLNIYMHIAYILSFKQTNQHNKQIVKCGNVYRWCVHIFLFASKSFTMKCRHCRFVRCVQYRSCEMLQIVQHSCHF